MRVLVRLSAIGWALAGLGAAQDETAAKLVGDADAAAHQVAALRASGRMTVQITAAGASETTELPFRVSRRHPTEAKAGGIGFLGPVTNVGFIYPAQGVTLDDVLVRNNGQEQVYLDSVTNSSVYNYFINGIYNGFVNNSCLSGSAPPVVSFAAPQDPLTYSTPGNYSNYRGGGMPQSRLGLADARSVPCSWLVLVSSRLRVRLRQAPSSFAGRLQPHPH